MKYIRGNVYVDKKQQYITFKCMDLDEVLSYCFENYNWHEIVEIGELILPTGKILNRKQIEKLWEQMKFISIGNNYFFKRN